MNDRTTCAIVGGGPAGMFLGLLLARAGVEVTLMEKHGDFLRDFRGDTVHPSTLRLLDELGLFECFDRLPQSRVHAMTIPLDEGPGITVADFRRLRLPHRYIAMVPQWDLLDMLADAGRAESTFTLRMNTEVTGLIREAGRVAGVTYQAADGPREVRADLTVACDGRWSVLRRGAGLPAHDYPVDFDVWWFRIPGTFGEKFTLLPRTAPGKAMIAIPREGYLQVALLAPKGADPGLRARGIEAFRADVVELMPEASDAVRELKSMDDVKYLDVQLNRLSRWHRPGLLCIGDAAHAMSPVGGVGINMAVQDAVAAATLLAGPLRERRVTSRELAAVQRRRVVPIIATQALQRVLHRAVIGTVLAGKTVRPPKTMISAFREFPQLGAVPAYLVGVGVRPEHAPPFARRPAGGPGRGTQDAASGPRT